MLGHGPTVGARHVADGNATAAGPFQVDGVHTHADFLHQFEPRRRIEHLDIHRTQAVPEHVGIREQPEQPIVVGFGTDGDIETAVAECVQALLQPGRGIVIPDDLHRCNRRLRRRHHLAERAYQHVAPEARDGVRVGLVQRTHGLRVVRFDDEQ
jgi:hypothetical protein